MPRSPSICPSISIRVSRETSARLGRPRWSGPLVAPGMLLRRPGCAGLSAALRERVADAPRDVLQQAEQRGVPKRSMEARLPRDDAGRLGAIRQYHRRPVGGAWTTGSGGPRSAGRRRRIRAPSSGRRIGRPSAGPSTHPRGSRRRRVTSCGVNSLIDGAYSVRCSVPIACRRAAFSASGGSAARPTPPVGPLTRSPASP